MPEISRFYGIVIGMFYDEHNPPHFHAVYGNHKVAVRIDNLAVISTKGFGFGYRMGYYSQRRA